MKKKIDFIICLAAQQHSYIHIKYRLVWAIYCVCCCINSMCCWISQHLYSNYVFCGVFPFRFFRVCVCVLWSPISILSEPFVDKVIRKEENTFRCKSIYISHIECMDIKIHFSVLSLSFLSLSRREAQLVRCRAGVGGTTVSWSMDKHEYIICSA